MTQQRAPEAVGGQRSRFGQVYTSIAFLERLGDPTATALAAALRVAARALLRPEEQKWSDRIEAFRQELIRSTDVVEMADYGAGADPMSPRATAPSTGHSTTRQVAELCAGSSVTQLIGRLLFGLVRQLEPLSCLELGTGLGISAAYEGAALTLNGAGTLLSLEGSPVLGSRAQRALGTLGLSNVTVRPGPFAVTLPQSLDDLGQIDFAFIDGHHDRDATVAYFHSISRYCRADSVLVFDDIAWSTEMAEAWQTIGRAPSTWLALDLGRVGVSVLRDTSPERHYLRVPIWSVVGGHEKLGSSAFLVTPAPGVG